MTRSEELAPRDSGFTADDARAAATQPSRGLHQRERYPSSMRAVTTHTQDYTEIRVVLPRAQAMEWAASARRMHMSLDQWITLGLELVDHLKLIEGYTKMPNQGHTLDPLLAEAMLIGARGKPWEHKVKLLVGTAALQAKPVFAATKPRASKLAINADALDRLIGHGLPVGSHVSGQILEIRGQRFTWRSAATIWYLWDRCERDWLPITDSALLREAGASTRAPAILKELFDPGGPIEHHPDGSRRVRLRPEFADTIADADYAWL